MKESDSLQEPSNVSYHSPLSSGAQTSDSTEADREGELNEGEAPAAGSERPSDNKSSSDSFSSTWGDTSSFWKGDTAKTKTSRLTHHMHQLEPSQQAVKHGPLDQLVAMRDHKLLNQEEQKREQHH